MHKNYVSKTKKKITMVVFLEAANNLLEKVYIEKDCCWNCLHSEVIQKLGYVEGREYCSNVYDRVCNHLLWLEEFINKVTIYSEHL